MTPNASWDQCKALAEKHGPLAAIRMVRMEGWGGDMPRQRPPAEAPNFGIQAPRPLGEQGWTCPKCGSVWSPSTPGCFTCNKRGQS